ncbi:hypothetical protein Patl1_33236 [Pistacia atlantica]|uniref:Uncharacterized protein n=1 Tax=Pistacia atlantica TaxID=434234 RepID=A0ACC1ANM9_9ROSI|nr:hypothetical protein Patl1_33236 [Pistacia atlantica]
MIFTSWFLLNKDFYPLNQL